MGTFNMKDIESRRVIIPMHRFASFKLEWATICHFITQYSQLDIKFNTMKKEVEIKNTTARKCNEQLQRAADFVMALVVGFRVQDSYALLRIDGIYTESFELKDVKTLQRTHSSRAIGRLVGKEGKVKIAIENATKTRIILDQKKIHILGLSSNIR